MVVVAGLKLAVIPLGRLAAERFTLCPEPFWSLTTIVLVALVPGERSTLLDDEVRLNADEKEYGVIDEQPAKKNSGAATRQIAIVSRNQFDSNCESLDPRMPHVVAIIVLTPQAPSLRRLYIKTDFIHDDYQK